MCNCNCSKEIKIIKPSPIFSRVAGDNLNINFKIKHSGKSNESPNDINFTANIIYLNYRITPSFLGTNNTPGAIVLNDISNFLIKKLDGSTFKWKNDQFSKHQCHHHQKIYYTEEDPNLSRIGGIILFWIQEYMNAKNFEDHLVASVELITDIGRVCKMYGAPPTIPKNTALI